MRWSAETIVPAVRSEGLVVEHLADETLIYDIGRERVQANPNEKDPGGVHITIKPKPKTAATTAPAPQPEQGPGA